MKNSDAAFKVLIIVLFVLIVGVSAYLFLEMNPNAQGIEAGIGL